MSISPKREDSSETVRENTLKVIKNVDWLLFNKLLHLLHLTMWRLP